MNTTILAKCIEELKAETPDISYIRGALETLLEMSTVSTIPPYLPFHGSPSSLNVPHITPNASRTETVADEDAGDPAVTAAYLAGVSATAGL